MQKPITPTKPQRIRREVKKILTFTDPFQRVDPRLLEKMHKEAIKRRVGDALL